MYRYYRARSRHQRSINVRTSVQTRARAHTYTYTFTRACIGSRREHSCRGKINDLPSPGTIQSAATLYVSEYSASRWCELPKVEQKHTSAYIAAYTCVHIHTLPHMSPIRIDLFPSRARIKCKYAIFIQRTYVSVYFFRWRIESHYGTYAKRVRKATNNN